MKEMSKKYVEIENQSIRGICTSNLNGKNTRKLEACRRRNSMDENAFCGRKPLIKCATESKNYRYQ